MTATETALRALVAALALAAAQTGAKIPAPRRNIALDQVADEAAQLDGAKQLSALVVSDGENESCVRYLGHPPSWELVHRVQIDWACAGAEGEALETAFDDGLVAIVDAISADPTLGGVVTLAECATPPERGLEIWGAKNAKTALITITLTYLSPRPF